MSLIACLQFLYIDLFIIIPVAVTSTFADNCLYRVQLTKKCSGSNASIPSNISKATNGQSGVQEGAVEHYWSNPHYECCSRLGLCLGSATGMVRHLRLLVVPLF